MNRNLLNAGLFVAVAGLGALLYLDDPKDAPKAPLTALKPADVTRIAIEHPGSPAIRLEKADGRWKLVAPVNAETDSFEVSALVGLADTQRQGELADPGLDYRALGLDPAAYRITLNDQTLDFGGDEPLKYRKYVRVNADKVALIDNPATAAIDADYSDLVSKSLLPAGATITRLALPGLTIEKNAAGNWSSPEHAGAKPADLQAVVDAWSAAKSMWNASAKAAPDGAPAPEAATLTLADGSTLAFTVVARDPQFVIDRADLGLRYTLARTDVDKLLALPAPPAAAADAGSDAAGSAAGTAGAAAAEAAVDTAADTAVDKAVEAQPASGVAPAAAPAPAAPSGSAAPR